MIKVNDDVIQRGSFPDGTLSMKCNSAKYLSDYATIEWRYESDEELFALICLKKHLDQCFEKIYLVMPYIPHARMDRVKHGDEIFTLKYFCEIINSLNFAEVCVCDAHSNVALALLNNVYEEKPDNEIFKVIDQLDNLTLFYPDEGAMKRYSSSFILPYAFGIKDREWETGKIKGLILQNAELVKDKNVLIIDDICSRGGTFYHSAKALKEAGAKDIYLFVTHLEHTVFEGEMISSGLIKKIFTTESIFFEEWTNGHQIEIIKKNG